MRKIKHIVVITSKGVINLRSLAVSSVKRNVLCDTDISALITVSSESKQG